MVNKCDKHFNRIYEGLEDINVALRELRRDVTDFNLQVTKISTRLDAQKKDIDHVTKIVHSAIGLTLTMVLTALIYLVIKKPG